jgi:hypothetical protein
MKRELLLGAVLGAALLTGIASGAVNGSAWTRVTDPDAYGSVGLARGTNGTLHVVWAKGGNAYDTSVNPGGKLGGRSTAVSGWASAAGPGAVVASDGTLRAFVPGSIHAGDTGPAVGIHTLTAPAAGGRWVLAPEVWGGALANQRDVNAVLGKDGEPVTAVGGGGAVFFRGVANGGSATILPPTPYSYDPEVATDAGSGAITALWFVNQGGQEGIVEQSVFPKGPQKFLGKATDVIQGGISGRIGAPGTYAVLASPTGLKFGKFGSGLGLVAKDTGIAAVDVAAGPEGRLWLSWLDNDGSLHAARTNKAASRLGAAQAVRPPAGSPTSFELRGEGSAGPLDAVARYRVGTQLAWWQTHVLPLLSLSAKRSTAGFVTVKVTDAGDPVKGASVTVAGKKASTNAQGVVTFSAVKTSGSAQASAIGYVTADGAYR